MADDEENDTRLRLKDALWFAVAKIVDEETMKHQKNASPQFIGALTEMVYIQIENVARDVESFSSHAGRTTVTTDDVLLLARRNEDLHALIKDVVDQRKAAKAKGKPKK